MTNKTKIIIGASVVALVGGYFIYKRMRINKPINNAIGDEDGKGVVPLAPPPIKTGQQGEIDPRVEPSRSYNELPQKPTKLTTKEVIKKNKLQILNLRRLGLPTPPPLFY